MEGPHVSVLLAEVMEALEPAPGKTIVDGTFGAGGYSRAFIEAGASVIAFDRDPSARRFAEGMHHALLGDWAAELLAATGPEPAGPLFRRARTAFDRARLARPDRDPAPVATLWRAWRAARTAR